MKQYCCPKSDTGTCKYGGNKAYQGAFSGTASFCYKVKEWVYKLKECPLKTENKK